MYVSQVSQVVRPQLGALSPRERATIAWGAATGAVVATVVSTTGARKAPATRIGIYVAGLVVGSLGGLVAARARGW